MLVIGMELFIQVQLEEDIQKSNNCPWDKYTCAAKGGHLEILKWLRSNGCPWGEFTSRYAARGGYLEIIEWLRENGCPQ